VCAYTVIWVITQQFEATVGAGAVVVQPRENAVFVEQMPARQQENTLMSHGGGVRVAVVVLWVTVVV
jgi:hypothetical protein